MSLSGTGEGVMGKVRGHVSPKRDLNLKTDENERESSETGRVGESRGVV